MGALPSLQLSAHCLQWNLYQYLHSSHDTLSDVVLSSESETTVCSELQLEVTARNKEGESVPGKVTGGFPVGT